MATKKSTAKKASSRPREIVSINLDAFEIIPRGATIVIESREPIDERALAAGLRFYKTRARTAVSERGRRVTVTVDESFKAGRNTLYLSDLYTPESKSLDVDLEVPFFVVDSRAPFPAEVKVESYSRVAVLDDRIRRAGPGESPSYELVKGVNRADGKPFEAAYDQAGKPVNFDEVRARVLKARLKRYGKLEPRLHERLAAGGGPVSVALWLRGAARVREKDERREVKKVTEAEVRARKAFLERTRRFAEQYQLAELSKNVRVDPSAPVVFAELEPDAVRRLAEAPEVAGVFLYERGGIDDLSNSIGIARSDKAHELGYNGSRVKVAVYERGPDNEDLLSIAARFRSDPDTSQHSRHTHGIIKNREKDRPHGHAPDCLLHSANDYDLDAARWAAQEQGCTVISQSFHRSAEQTSGDLSFDDVYKDWLALHWPYPTFCEAAGNGADTEFVNHKGFNRLTVANHNDAANGMAGDTVFRNPDSDHGDRELPEISANGMGVTAVGLTLGGTSMAAPAVAGATACVQEVNSTLKSWPEGCRAIQLAAARLNPDGGLWWSDIVAGADGVDGAGALDTLNAVRIAEQRKGRDNRPSLLGWDVGTLRSADIGRNGETTFSYRIATPALPAFLQRTRVKVALAWDSDVDEFSFFGITFPVSSRLTVDLDLKVYDSAGRLVGYSGSYDNSYEIAEFTARAGETYTIKIRRWSGTDSVWYGIAWQARTTPLVFDPSDITVLQP